MKKLLIILLAGIFIAGCNGNDEEENSNGEDNGNDQAEENNGDDDSENNGDEQKEIYQIGETAEGTSSSHGFPYEVTVNDFEITTEFDGQSIEEFYMEGSEPTDDARLGVVNITLRNTGDESFIPDSTMTPYLTGEFTSDSALTGTFPESEEELETGSEITGNLVFLGDVLLDEEVLYLTYNIDDPNLEFKFELPVNEE